jgi:hypothetical protein
MTIPVHPSFERDIKLFDPRLIVRPNPQPVDESERYFVCEPVKFLVPMFEEPVKAALLKTEYFPILSIPQAQEIDCRVVRDLYRNRIQRAGEWHKKAEEAVFAERKRMMDRGMEMTEEAAEEMYYYWKKEFGHFNWANVPSVDPTRGTKELEDKLGRELNR